MESVYASLKLRISELEALKGLTSRDIIRIVLKDQSIDWKAIREQERDTRPEFDSKHWKTALI